VGILVLAAGLAPSTASAIGFLVPSDRSLEPLAISTHRVEATITDRAAVTKVEQVFQNNTDRILEGTYIFPLPEGASVSQFALWVNGTRTEGEVLERDAAARIYQDIVARIQDPGLIEYMGNNLFKARVFPIPARGEQRLEIQFTSTLTYDGGLMRYVYPMKTAGQSAQTIRDFTLTVRIDSAIPIQTIYSPSHEVDVQRRDDHHATAGLEENRAVLGHDFELYYAVSAEDVGLSLLTHRPDGEDGYFMMMVTPRNDIEDAEIMGKHVTFVIDSSGSMSGEKMERARQALRFCLEHLRSDDRFNVIRFSSDVEPLSSEPLTASRSNVERALAFVDRMRALGGTAIADALSTALRQPTEEGVPHMVVFLTDGMPTVGQTDPGRILDGVAQGNDKRARIFVFGVGDDVNANFLDRISQENRGATEYARGGEELELKLSAFYSKIAYPVMADLAVRVSNDIDLFDLYPREMPDLFHGSQLLVLGRYRGNGDSEVALGGKVGSQTKTYTYDVNFPRRTAQYDFLPHMWATRKVGWLLDQIRLHGESREVRDEIIALGRRYGIVTPYTSFLVTEDSPRPTTRWDDDVRFGAVPTDSADAWDEESSGRWRGGPTGGGGASGSTARPTVPASAAPAPEYHALRALEAVQTSAGDMGGDGALGNAGRVMSEQIRDMRESDRTQTGALTRYVAGRLFLRQGERWIEDGAANAARTLEIKYLSDAYFALLRLCPDLREALSLGQDVTFKVGTDAAVVVRAEGGRDRIPDEELRRFVER
jgi:Ca-activated chloride channel family protein